MSGYQGRTGPNFSEYLNNLNTVSPPYDPAQFTDELVDFGNDLSMFTNTDFTHIDDPSLNFDLPADPQTNLYEDFLPSAGPTKNMNNTQIQSPIYSNYNTPIQPAPIANFPQIQSAQNSNQPNQQRKKADPISPAVSPEERSRLAAEEDKRRRNTAASARFRVKKKQREQALEKTVKEVQDKNTKLESKLSQLEMENRWLKELITEKHGYQSKEEISAAYQKYRKESEEREVKDSPPHTTGVGTN